MEQVTKEIAAEVYFEAHTPRASEGNREIGNLVLRPDSTKSPLQNTLSRNLEAFRGSAVKSGDSELNSSHALQRMSDSFAAVGTLVQQSNGRWGLEAVSVVWQNLALKADEKNQLLELLTRQLTSFTQHVTATKKWNKSDYFVVDEKAAEWAAECREFFSEIHAARVVQQNRAIETDERTLTIATDTLQAAKDAMYNRIPDTKEEQLEALSIEHSQNVGEQVDKAIFQSHKASEFDEKLSVVAVSARTDVETWVLKRKRKIVARRNRDKLLRFLLWLPRLVKKILYGIVAAWKWLVAATVIAGISAFSYSFYQKHLNSRTEGDSSMAGEAAGMIVNRCAKYDIEFNKKEVAQELAGRLEQYLPSIHDGVISQNQLRISRGVQITSDESDYYLPNNTEYNCGRRQSIRDMSLAVWLTAHRFEEAAALAGLSGRELSVLQEASGVPLSPFLSQTDIQAWKIVTRQGYKLFGLVAEQHQDRGTGLLRRNRR